LDQPGYERVTKTMPSEILNLGFLECPFERLSDVDNWALVVSIRPENPIVIGAFFV